MEVIFLIVLPAVLWAQSWYFLDLYTNTRTLGMIAAVVAIVLGGMVVFAGGSYSALGGAPADIGAVLGAFIALWAIYAAIVAAVHLGGFDERTLGLYSLFLAIVSILYVVYFFAGGEVLGGAKEGVLTHWPMGIVSIALAVFAGLVFFHLAPPYPRLRFITGWYTLVISIVIALLGGLVILGVEIN